MEELQVIETTSGRQFKPWATKDDVQDPASVTAIASEIASGKQAIAAAINAKGGSASATESFSELAQDIQDTPTSGVLSSGIVQSEPFSFLDYVCKQGAYPFTEIDDDSVTVIDRGSGFSGRANLLKVKMTALRTISGGSVFASCSALQEVDMPQLTTISGGSVFASCSALQEVDMPQLTTISGERAFASCSALQEVDMPQLTTISGGYMFYQCSALQEVNLPILTTISGGLAFQGCSSLQEINLPILTTISGQNTFVDCSALQDVNIPNLIIISGDNTFTRCSSLQDVTFGTLTSIIEPFKNGKPNLRNITIGQDTNINLPFQQWTATDVIAEGQSGIDELNTNLQTNLISKLYQGGGKILRLGTSLYDVTTQETRDMVTAKGWTLQRG